MASPSQDMKYVWFLVEGRLPRAGETLLSLSILFPILDPVPSDSYCMFVVPAPPCFPSFHSSHTLLLVWILSSTQH